MTAGLAVSDIANVSVTLSPVATATRNFGTVLILGNSPVLSSAENTRAYTSLTAVGNDFAVTTPEYLAALDFFAQSPQPSLAYVGAMRTGETLAASIVRLASATSDWYCVIPAIVGLTDSVLLSAAQTVEGLSPVRIIGITTQEATALLPTVTTDLASTLSAATLTRTMTQYSSTDPYAAASLFGRIATVNYNGNATALTLMFQQEPGVTAETLTETAAATLTTKRCNCWVNYNNGAAIIQNGVMASNFYIDERVGLDWLQNALQVAGFNALYGAGTKIPQTDAGMTILTTAYTQVLDQGVANGLIAPGVWTGPAFGSLSNGQALVKGYYLYAAPVSTQSAADRAARKATAVTIAVKLAGAIHETVVQVDVVR